MSPRLLLSLRFYCWTNIKWYEISLWSAWDSCLDYFSSESLAHAQPTGLLKGGECGETTLMLGHHCSLANSFLTTSTKHSTIGTAVGESDSIPDRPSAAGNKYLHVLLVTLHIQLTELGFLRLWIPYLY